MISNEPAAHAYSFSEPEYDQGETGKMSASDPNSAIYVTDSSKDIKNKVCLLCSIPIFIFLYVCYVPMFIKN